MKHDAVLSEAKKFWTECLDGRELLLVVHGWGMSSKRIRGIAVECISEQCLTEINYAEKEIGADASFRIVLAGHTATHKICEEYEASGSVPPNLTANTRFAEDNFLKTLRTMRALGKPVCETYIKSSWLYLRENISITLVKPIPLCPDLNACDDQMVLDMVRDRISWSEAQEVLKSTLIRREEWPANQRLRDIVLS